MSSPIRFAPGAPGLAPTWTSSDKDAVTTSLGRGRVWASVGHGNLNEIYWPTNGDPQVRDLSFLIRTPQGWFDLKRTSRYRLMLPPEGPAIGIRHRGPGFTLNLDVVPDPQRDSLLIAYRLSGDAQLYALLAPHLGDSGEHNTAWVEDEALFARRGENVLTLLASGGFTRASAGFVGVSDGWQDFNRHGEMTWTYDRAEDGNVALLGELQDKAGVLALAFANRSESALLHARSSVHLEFSSVRGRFLSGWQTWTESLKLPAGNRRELQQARLSAQVIRVHEGRDFPGGIIASLSVPFGQSHSDGGGYHLVWPRDMVEGASALLAAGQHEAAQRALQYLLATQGQEGCWPQNIFPDGETYWTGEQLDETAFAVLLAAKMREQAALGDVRAVSLARGMQRAAAYLVQHGPLSQEDRWEENSGVSAYTLATIIAALVGAAPWLSVQERAYALALADDWNDRLDGWCYVSGEDAPLAERYGVPGYYIRIAPQATERPGQQDVTVANTGGLTVKAGALISLDFGYLVRLGLRDARDPRIQHTLRVVDGELRYDSPGGPVYYRYPHDGYGNKEDGGGFDGQGIGRPWPLLSGERGHLALLSGESPAPYLNAMLESCGPGGLFPEQIWDKAALPDHGFFPGKPAGSAMPLMWAHAEFIKLLWAREHGAPFECLQAVHERYAAGGPKPTTRFWRTNSPVNRLPKGMDLLIEDARPFTLHLGHDQWQNVRDLPAQALPFGRWGVRLRASALRGQRSVEFTRLFAEGWEGRDHQVRLG
ncbi:glucan 1,4-alpha-glucosidase [Deinococcus irradiatisoli]|uniref:Glucan 1,4-alpha-glucosidase n=1 Tax=Deinococcus irradiatisoli TaxID=2202254 RepID=A0A2Z3JAN6_9DEIO|nr:glycoside hydrolase family 15 protein [Deinococcus irradiatisoli]AWN22167.1 glucan 1,4-alpha-glucosidase [Deinococcus irradiatisoli]